MYNNPLFLLKVIFLEPKVLYRSAVDEVPIGDYELPLGQADIVRRLVSFMLASLSEAAARN
jgi:pyruvate/2-oxoglutarate/acetoin dehydrogenase E1 component